MTTRTISLTLAMVLSMGVAGAAHAAPNAVGPRLNIELDGTDLALGVEGRFGLVRLGGPVRLDVRPSFDYYLIDDDVTAIQIAIDAIFAFDIHNSAVEPYALAGLSIGYFKVEGFDGDTEPGLNLGGGAKFLTTGRIQPFVELRVTVGDFDPILLGGGVLFII